MLLESQLSRETTLPHPTMQPALSLSQIIVRKTTYSHKLVPLSLDLFLPLFPPSIQTNIFALSVLGAGYTNWDRTIPCPQRAPSWNIPAAFPFPAPQAQTQVRPPGKPSAQGSQAWAESPRGGDTHRNSERKRQSDSQGTDRVIEGRREGRKGEPEGHKETDGQSCK